MKALFLNCSLKKSDDVSNTQALMDEVAKILQTHHVDCESVRIGDYHIPYGITDDVGDGDQWPEILTKIRNATIVVIGTPLWIAKKAASRKMYWNE
ncbi:NAD(P)H-dependent oxidoreductase [Bacillus sp. JCM 19041]|uniref:flavodoxin family protein n=1 Tax=Bacillus sp. JCM 19041 TaxID=1460637 RepID=UPI000B0B15CA